MFVLLLLISICYFKIGDTVGLIGADPWICKVIEVNRTDCSYTIQFHIHNGQILYDIKEDKLVPIKNGQAYCY